VPIISSSNILGISRVSVGIFYKNFQQLIITTLEDGDQKIGGDGIVVEIDESKFGKRKYNRGHKVEGVWIVGGVERTEERKVFLKIVENRNQETLTEIINTHVYPGSIIITDCWKAYNFIEDKTSNRHLKVNHSETFKDEITGAHTNTIEGTWFGIKQNINPRHRTAKQISGHLFEFIWRRKNQNNLWNAFIEALKDVHYENK
jgi:transposase-like protein